MRSAAEIAYRLRQEIANLALLRFPPSVDITAPAPLAGLPHPEALHGTAIEARIMEAAENVLAGRYRILGYELDLGKSLAWRADPVHRRETPPAYFRTIPYLDFSLAGDHKIIWESNRHQHLVILAQAFALSGREEFVIEIVRQWQSWTAQNRFQRGINWASALEVAFRALSWIWIYHLTGSHLEPSFRKSFLNGLYQHGCHLEYNLSIYFSPNTHLLGEAVALHALGALFPQFPRARKWDHLGAQVVREQLARQIRPDGAHFEQSTYYHVYALDFFLLHYILAGRPADFEPSLQSMAEYLDAVMGPQRRIPLIGDDDGGRVFFPGEPCDRHGRASLSTCAVLLNRPEWFDAAAAEEQTVWWLGPVSIHPAEPAEARSRIFRDSGSAILAAGDFWILVNAGPFGPFRAGHTHSHALSMVVRYRDQDILVDPGTYTYMSDPALRNWFRGSAAHNTIRVNGLDQAPPAGPFAWAGKPVVTLESWESNDESDLLVASCAYAGSPIVHRRGILFQKPGAIFILDEISGVVAPHVEQWWHAGESVTALSGNSFRIGDVILSCSAGVRLTPSERSSIYGRKEPAAAIVASAQDTRFIGACLYMGNPGELLMSVEDNKVRLEIQGANLQATFDAANSR